MKPLFLFTLAGSTVALLADYRLKIDIPELNVLEYNKPFVAAWITDSDRNHRGNLALWYQQGEDGTEGAEWLPDMRKWWRISGKALDLPVEGYSGPTRGPGSHEVLLTNTLSHLQPGKYSLFVEAAREVGDHEVLKLKFFWDGSTIHFKKSSVKKGSKELAQISITDE